MKNPQFYNIALEAGGTHYPDVGGELLEQALTMVVKRCAEIARLEPQDPAGSILQYFGVNNENN